MKLSPAEEALCLLSGMVRTEDGKIVDRSEICWNLKQDKDDPTIYYDRQGNVYKKINSGGTLKRISGKKRKRE